MASEPSKALAETIIAVLGVYYKAPHPGEEASREVALMLDEARREALTVACEDVCLFCGRRSQGWEPAQGPNEAGNWTHYNPRYSTREEGTRLCAASTLHARLRYEEGTRGK